MQYNTVNLAYKQTEDNQIFSQNRPKIPSFLLYFV